MVSLKLFAYFFCVPFTVVYIVGTLRTPPKCLQLWSNGNSVKDLTGNSLSSLLENCLIITILPALRTLLQINERTDESYTAVYTHVVHHRFDACDICNFTFDLIV